MFHTDISGKRFGRLIAVAIAGRARSRAIRWECICDCGITCIKDGCSLRNGDTSSCGCLRRERLIARSKVENKTHGLSFSPTYYSWKSMIQRCINPKHSAYARYGGAGIKVCDSWLKFDGFMADMGERPADKTLDRIDPRGDYSPENCRWATRIQQANNRLKSVRHTMNGESKTLAEWAAQYQIPYQLVHKRMTCLKRSGRRCE